MENRQESLLVRQHERVKCHLRAHVSAAAECAAQVRLARTLGDGSRVIPAAVIDCSPGGIGINSTVFFPRGSLLTARLTGPDGAVMYDGMVRVQRCSMIGREPTYYLGASFVQKPDSAATDALLDAARASGAAPPAKGAAVA